MPPFLPSILMVEAYWNLWKRMMIQVITQVITINFVCFEAKIQWNSFYITQRRQWGYDSKVRRKVLTFFLMISNLIMAFYLSTCIASWFSGSGSLPFPCPACRITPVSGSYWQPGAYTTGVSGLRGLRVQGRVISFEVGHFISILALKWPVSKLSCRGKTIL